VSKELLNQAIRAHQANDFAKAEQIYLKILESNPKNHSALRCLGTLNAQLKKYDEAIELYEKAIKIKPEIVDTYIDLSKVLYQVFTHKQSYYNKAVNVFQKILKRKPSHIPTLENFIEIYKSNGQFKEASILNEKLIKIDPQNLNYLNNYAIMIANLGKTEEAKELFKKVLELDENYSSALYNLLTMFKPGDDFNLLKDKALQLYKKLDEDKRISLGFALAKIYEKEKDYDTAFEFLKESNTAFSKKNTYKHDQYVLFFENIKEAFTKNYFNKVFKGFETKLTPIFIVGMPRSGTSLVEQIISSHPEVYGAGELHLITRILHSHLGLAKTGLKDRIDNYDSELYERMGHEYIDALSVFSSDHKFITDKMPINFSYLGFIKLILPKAKIVHIQRNPKDTMFSCYKQYLPGGNYFANDIQDLQNYYGLYLSIMEHWRQVLPKDSFYEIKYEDLLEDQKKETEALLNYCGLSWDDSCLKFHENKRVVGTASRLQVQEPIYKASLNQWQNYEKFLAWD